MTEHLTEQLLSQMVRDLADPEIMLGGTQGRSCRGPWGGLERGRINIAARRRPPGPVD